MTKAQWIASIEPTGTLTTSLAADHAAQAVNDGDAANLAALQAGGTLTALIINTRVGCLAVREILLINLSIVLGDSARTSFINAMSNYYTVTGAP